MPRGPLRRPIASLILMTLWACGGAGDITPAPSPEEARFEATRVKEIQRARHLKAALLRLEQAEEAARKAPTVDTCAAIREAGATSKEAWAGFIEIEQTLTRHAAPWPERAADRRRAVEIARGGAAIHAEQLERWGGLCAQVKPSAPVPLAPAAPRRIAPDLIAYGGLLLWRAEPSRLLERHGAWRAARRLAARLPGGPTILIFMVPHADPRRAYEAAALIRPRRYPKIKRWPGLRGIFVMEAETGLAEGPSLHHLARVVAPRLEGSEWSRRGYWGGAMVAGQLGGLRGERPSVGWGGNAAPYAEIELALMGLRGWEGITRPLGGPTLEALRAAAPVPPRRWRLGVVLVDPSGGDEALIEAQREGLAAFTQPGPDADPFRYNFHEATGGAGRLEAHRW